MSWRGRPSNSRSSARVTPRAVRTNPPVGLSALAERRGRRSSGVVVEASVLARLLGIRLLRLDATVVVVPADVTSPSSASYRIAEARVRTTRPRSTRSFRRCRRPPGPSSAKHRRGSRAPRRGAPGVLSPKPPTTMGLKDAEGTTTLYRGTGRRAGREPAERRARPRAPLTEPGLYRFHEDARNPR